MRRSWLCCVETKFAEPHLESEDLATPNLLCGMYLVIVTAACRWWWLQHFSIFAAAAGWKGSSAAMWVIVWLRKAKVDGVRVPNLGLAS